jgi:FkbM family methyltransferase
MDVGLLKIIRCCIVLLKISTKPKKDIFWIYYSILRTVIKNPKLLMDSKASKNNFLSDYLPKTIQIQHPTGINFLSRPKFEDLARFLFAEIIAKWEPIKIIHMSKEEIFVDIGANTGYYTLNIASKLREGKIISIEADPDTFKILEKNCNMNKIYNLEMHNVACSNHEGNIDFFKTDKHSGINSILNQTENNNFNKIKIKSNTLDNILNSRFKKIDWIKIDVEGAELFVLEGAQETLNYTKHIIIEIHEHILKKNNQTSKQIIDILEKNNFEIKIFPEYWKSSSPNQILKSDYIYGEK